tara:strand:+ start:40 stop:336 length:297 start_codon:yes stop_codon:yes gene_type:complete
MRFIKQQTTNLRRIQPTAKGVKQDIDDQVVMVSERALRVPVGTLSQRPGEAGIATTAAVGQVRYNTTDQQLEAYLKMVLGENYDLKNLTKIQVLFGRT